MRTGKYFAVGVGRNLVFGDAYAYRLEALKYLCVPCVPSVKDAAEKTFQARIGWIDADAEQMELAVPVAWLDAQLYSRKTDAVSVAFAGLNEFGDAVAVVVIRERHRIEASAPQSYVRWRNRSVARRAVYMKVDHMPPIISQMRQ